MTISNRKMNNYSFMRISTVFVLSIALVVSTFVIPFVPRTGAEALDNNPPDEPKNPEPANGSTDVAVTISLAWTGGDPDGDNVTYDVYFENSSPPMLVVHNQTKTTYDPPGNLAYDTQYFWRIVAWDEYNASTVGPEWQFMTEKKTNNPPNIPSGESPENGSVDVSLSAVLSWTGGDPDVGDTVTYDVYFGTSSPPGKIEDNYPNTSVDPGVLTFNTTYYWRIIAWDNNNASRVGPLWHFTTMQEVPLTVTITKPLAHKLYLNDNEQMDLSGNTIVYRKITIEATVNSSNDIAWVIFEVDGKELTNITGNTSEGVYSYLWEPIIQFNSALSLKRNITVIAYDTEGNNASAYITIIKWRFHILPWVLAGMAIASRFVLHTTVVGTFFNVQQSRFSCSFYVIRAHYKTVGPFQMRRGVIHFKHVTGGMIIGPQTLTKIGPFHRIAIGSFTYIGGMNAERIGLGGALLSGLSSRSSGGPLLNLYRALKS